MEVDKSQKRKRLIVSYDIDKKIDEYLGLTEGI